MTRPAPRAASLIGSLSAAALVSSTMAAAPSMAAGQAAAAPSDGVLISEYVEGSSNNKALEVFNGSGEAIDLSGYQLQVFYNGADSAGLSLDLSGTLASGEVYVVASSGAAEPILDRADQTTGAGLWNGDDAISLLQDGAVVDSVGQQGVDPGSAWGSGATTTSNATLRRAASVCAGDPVADDPFDPAAEWQGLPIDTVDGLGEHTTDCESGADGPVLNEFSASTTGTDVEYLEVLGVPTGESDLTVLQVEGDSSSSALGQVSTAHPVGEADADGRWLGELPGNTLQNGTLSLLLVSGYVDQVVVDEDQDGQIDEGLGLELVDSVAVDDGDTGDLTYGPVTLGVEYDGLAFAPGGASRIPDGTDTDDIQDWVRNDFDLAGIEGETGSPEEGEAFNTPGATNAAYEGTEPPPGGSCGDPAMSIGEVQGSGDASPLQGQDVELEGTVVGDFQDGGYDGFALQDVGDQDPATSDGVFVYAPGGAAVALGDTVRVSGTVSEFFGLTQVNTGAVQVCAADGELFTPVELTLPVDDASLEATESMRVTFPQDLTILEYFNYGRYGEIALGTERQFQPTAIFEPGSAEAEALMESNLDTRITLDDGRSVQNPDPAIHPNGEEFTLENTFRGGDLVTDATGVLDYRFDLWRLQPTQGATYTAANPRPDVPQVGGSTTVASFNVLNYFTTLGERGADTPEELERQQAKIVSALSAMDADVVGLIEIENNGTAVATLVEALNAEVGAGTYAYIDTGKVGTDAITTAFIYQPAQVSPVGDFATLTSEDDPRFLDDYNRPTLAQTFTDVQDGGAVTVAVNHLKSKGSSCDEVGDPTDPDGQGNCNGVRTDAAAAMADWLAGDPTGSGVQESLVIGDLNSYDKEDPIDALTGAGFTDLLLERQGERAYSYVFDGMLGYLDYALATDGLTDQVTGADVWRINADEPSLLDYDTSFKRDAQDAIYAPDPYRSSDHDPVLVGLDLSEPDTVAPELELTVDPELVWPPNNKWREVSTSVQAVDDSGEVSTTLVDATADGRRAEVEVVDDTTFRVRASKGAVYTFTYEATDAAGNTTTESVTATVERTKKGKGRGRG